VCAHGNEKKVSTISATIKDIAKKCGVSEGTVDRALNNRCGIKKETKEKIMQVAEELGYRPNHMASCLARGNTKTIGVVCAGIMNAFFSSFVEAIEREAYENGYYLTLILTHNSKEKEREGIIYLAERQVDGLIIFPIGQGKDYEQWLLQFNIPIVTVYNRISDKFVHVDVDGRHIMQEAVSRIVKKGYKRIAYIDVGYDIAICHDNNRYSLNQRRQGYLDGVQEQQLGEPLVMTRVDEKAIKSFIEADGGKPAILCPFDNVAIRVLNLMRNQGISVPEQVGIMGFDNIPLLDSISPRLYSVDCETKEMGRNAFSILLKMMRGNMNVSDCMTDYTFTEGCSL